MAQKQHVDISRKLSLRKRLLEKAGKLPGAYYVPFIGEGDIAVLLYNDKTIFGADIDKAMLHKAIDRLKKAELIVADCDTFPFKKSIATFTLADFDAYSYPYDAFRSFWEKAKIGSQCVLFFTDGQRQAIHRNSSYKTPQGKKVKLKDMAEMSPHFNFYFNKIVLPWFREYIKPWEIQEITKYLRSGAMCYWGAIVTKGKQPKEKAEKVFSNKCDSAKKEKYLEHLRNGHTRGYAANLVGIHRKTMWEHMKTDPGFAEAVSEAETDAVARVENALFEAAVSGNVTAIQVYLYNRDPDRWTDKRNFRLAGEGGGPIEVKLGPRNFTDEELEAIIRSGSGSGTTGEASSQH